MYANYSPSLQQGWLFAMAKIFLPEQWKKPVKTGKKLSA
jgi:hypothetical protein